MTQIKKLGQARSYYLCRQRQGRRGRPGGKSNNEDPTMQDDDPRDVPLMQQILDNPFILLFIGIAIPTLTYIVWGIMELVSLPISSP